MPLSRVHGRDRQGAGKRVYPYYHLYSVVLVLFKVHTAGVYYKTKRSG